MYTIICMVSGPVDINASAVTSHVTMFVPVFYALCLVCLILYVYTHSKVADSDDVNFRSFQRVYLSVYLLAVGTLISTKTLL